MLPLRIHFGAQPQPGVLVRDDARAGRTERQVRAGLVPVPVGVEQRVDFGGAGTLLDQLQHFGERSGEPPSTNSTPSRGVEYGHIAAAARDDEQSIADVGNREWCALHVVLPRKGGH